MRRQLISVTVLVCALGVGGCSTAPLSNALSSLQVCNESERIFSDMEEIFLLALVNPLAITTYAGELGELSDEFGALEPRDESLALAHSELSGRIELVLAAVENPSLSALPRIPTLIAEIQVASRAFSDECSL